MDRQQIEKEGESGITLFIYAMTAVMELYRNSPRRALPTGHSNFDDWVFPHRLNHVALTQDEMDML